MGGIWVGAVRGCGAADKRTVHMPLHKGAMLRRRKAAHGRKDVEKLYGGRGSVFSSIG